MLSPLSTDSNWSARLWWTLVGAGLMDWAFRILSDAPDYTWVALTAVLAGAWGLGTVLVSWIPQIASPNARAYGDVFAWATALICVLCFAVWAAVTVHGLPAYGTDELAFDQYAGFLVQHGINPYTHSMNGAFQMFRVSPAGYTYTLTGARVTQLSYPALSFLFYVPFLLLGWTRQLGVGLDVAGWMLSTLLIFKLLPRPLRPCALLLGSGMAYVQLSVVGLTDMLFMPMLVLAAYRWDRFGIDRRSYIGPVMFGLAMAVKQTPWPILPFILLALALDERARSDLNTGIRRAARYLGATLIAFAIPNLAFIVMSPSAWVRGTLTPLIKNLVPAGQGAISFSLFLHLGGGSLLAYSVLAGLVLLLLLVTYCGTYPLLRAATFALPAVAYFFAVRSYTDYLIALVPPGLVAAVTAESQPLQAAGRLIKSRRWSTAIAGCGGLCVIALIYTLASSSPLALRITQVDTGGSNNIAVQVSVRVTNHTGSPVKPAFTMQTSGGVSSFWWVLHGPPKLAAGASATYLLGSPDTDSQFTVNDGIRVEAFLTSPASVSVSNNYVPPLWHVGYDPESVDKLIPVGQPVVIGVQLLNVWDEPIKQARVPITMSGSNPNRPRLVTINGHLPGSHAIAYTNAQGIATFRIVGRGTSLYPETLSAAPPIATSPIGLKLGYTVAASGTVLLRFKH